MTLQDVFQAPYDYDNDIKIIPHSEGWQYGIYNQVYGWTFREKVFTAPEINDLLQRRGYHLVNKRDEQVLFEPCWDYRQNQPEWETFRGWLYVYYAYKQNEYDVLTDAYKMSASQKEEYENTLGRRDACIVLMEQVHDEKPDFEHCSLWILKKIREMHKEIDAIHTTAFGKRWETTRQLRQQVMVFKHFGDTLGQYKGLMER